MKLLIISAMPHYRRGDQIVGWGPTAQEIDHLSGFFSEVRHIACLHPEPAPSSALPYESKRVTPLLVPASGGPSLRHKLDILRLAGVYLRAMLRELPQADVVHVRCPANISLLAIVLLSFVRSPKLRWVKYAGNWSPDGREAFSYTFQRWWLNRGLHRGLVTVNGAWPGQPAHVISFVNPCLTTEELAQAQVAAVAKKLASPVRLIYVGRLESDKGVGRAIRVLAELSKQGCAAMLDLVGDGPERVAFEQLANECGVAAEVCFHGWMARPALSPLYARSHLMLMPTSCSEGWPKVLSEAMAYGVVPLAGKVSSVPQFLRAFGSGRAIAADDLAGYVQAILEYTSAPTVWQRESAKAVEAAGKFTYARYLEDVRNLLKLPRISDV